MKDNFKENIEKAITAKDKCGDQYCQITINHDWKIEVYAHPSEEELHATVSALTGLTGKLTKKQEMFGTSFEFSGEKDSISVRIRTPEQCKIVGHRIEKRPKRVIVESAEIEEIRTPVTDCDFRTGKVKAGEFEPLKEEVPA